MNWYENDTLWEIFYDCMFDKDSFQMAQQQVSEVLSLLNHDVTSVLDLGCGPGRHALAFAKMDYQVTGVDMSQYLLSKAKSQAQEQSLQVEFIQADMLNFKIDKSYDLIINMFNSFGYFDTPEKNQQVIQNAYNNLSHTGTFIIDMVGKETLARTIEPVHLSEYSNGDLRIERPLLIDNMQVFSNEWILIRENKAFKHSYQHYVYTPIEITTMCKLAGFNQVKIYGSLMADDYDLECDRLVVVAEKH